MLRMLHVIIALTLVTGHMYADGLLVSTDDAYPVPVMRNRLTSVEVTITGLVAETVVYQEFVNDWYRTTDAVWVFPLPPDARATALYYWRHDTLFQAVLRVQEQVITPGTGDGGVPAEINQYIGRNGLKVELKQIDPWSIQRVELHYISICDYSFGEGRYHFPFSAADIVRHPLDVVEFTLHLNAGTDIVHHDLTPLPAQHVQWTGTDNMTVRATRSKIYPTSDIEFFWRTEDDTLGVDFFSGKADSSDGYYALLIRPPERIGSEAILRKRLIVVVESSSRMSGTALAQCRTAIGETLEDLGPLDEFNIVAFANSADACFSRCESASTAAIEQARIFLDERAVGGGVQLGIALQRAMNLCARDSLQNIILVLTTGRSPVEPEAVTAMNTVGASLVMIGIGDDADRSRLTMIAEQHAGFSRILSVNEHMGAEISRLLRSVQYPLMRDVGVEYPDVSVYGVRPTVIAPLFAGMYTLTAGRYRNPGLSPMSLFGKGRDGWRSYNFELLFSGDSSNSFIAQKLWAKLIIDDLEREIDVYGPRESLRDSLIAISLASGIRCRYTAYIANYTNIVSGLDAPETGTAARIRECHILGNYPNPFNPSTTIRVQISRRDRMHGPLYLYIYDVLGRLVRIITLSHLTAGIHEIHFDGRGSDGHPLPSGEYLVVLHSSRQVSTHRMLLIK